MTPVTDRLDATSDRGGAFAARPHRRAARAWILAIGAAGVVVAVWFTYSSLYAPLSPASFSGPRSPAIRPLTDGIASTRLILTGAVGQRGTMVYSLRNDGRFSVRILGLTTHDWSTEGMSLRVGPGVGRGELVGGHPDETKPFPVTVRPGVLTQYVLVRAASHEEGVAVEPSRGPVQEHVPEPQHREPPRQPQ